MDRNESALSIPQRVAAALRAPLPKSVTEQCRFNFFQVKDDSVVAMCAAAKVAAVLSEKMPDTEELRIDAEFGRNFVWDEIEAALGARASAILISSASIPDEVGDHFYSGDIPLSNLLCELNNRRYSYGAIADVLDDALVVAV